MYAKMTACKIIQNAIFRMVAMEIERNNLIKLVNFSLVQKLSAQLEVKVRWNLVHEVLLKIEVHELFMNCLLLKCSLHLCHLMFMNYS